MEASRIERFLDDTPQVATLIGYLIAFAFFGHLMHDFAANFSYNLLCVVWIASVSLVCLLVKEWNTMRNRSFGLLSDIIGQENTMLIMLVASMLFSLVIPFVALYKWLVL
jgi:hypothetical protein